MKKEHVYFVKKHNFNKNFLMSETKILFFFHFQKCSFVPWRLYMRPVHNCTQNNVKLGAC